MKKPQWILIGITAMFICVLLGFFLGRNTSDNYIPTNNGAAPSIQNGQNAENDDGKININKDIAVKRMINGVSFKVVDWDDPNNTITRTFDSYKECSDYYYRYYN